MRKILLPLLITQTLALNVAADGQSSLNTNQNLRNNLIPPTNSNIGYLWTKDANTAQNLATSTGGVNFYAVRPHSNPVAVMPVIETTPIFWGTTWETQGFSGDKFFGLLEFYQNFQDSTYANSVTEYLPYPLSHTLLSPIIDATPASSDPNALLTEICNMVGYPSSSNTQYYPVYTDIPRGSASYCSFHAAGTCYGVPVQYAFFFDLDDDPECDPASPYAPPLGAANSQNPGSVEGIDAAYQMSQGLAALGNVSAHEIVETITDPAAFSANGNFQYWEGWYDILGLEIGDKCAWTFGPSNITDTAMGTVLIGGSYWKIQGVWSNQAEKAGSAGPGYPTQSINIYGCITGS